MTAPRSVIETTEDDRQKWVCVTPEGPRTRDERAIEHPPFHSDEHITTPGHAGRIVRCPTCGSASVRMWNEADEQPPVATTRDARLVARGS